MSIKPSTTTLYIDPHFLTNPRKLDNRVEQVVLYGAKEAKTMLLSDVISDKAVLERFAVSKIEGNSERIVKKGEVDPNEGFRKVEYKIGDQKVDEDDPFDLDVEPIVPTRLLVGFDTEYVAPPTIKYEKGKPKPKLKEMDPALNRVISYQYYAILPSPMGDAIKEWSGIIYVKEGERISRSQLMSAVYSKAFEDPTILKLPHSVILVGHYTKADLPGFSDFTTFRSRMDAVRRSFVTVIHDPEFAKTPLEVPKGSDEKNVFILLRDTFLLCPSLEGKSLKKVGELVGIPKEYVSKEDIRQMDEFLKRDRIAFEKYAIRDAEIAVKYALRIYKNQSKIGLRKDVPPTLSGIGVGLLFNYWIKKHRNKTGERNNKMPLEMLGLKHVRDSKYVKATDKKSSHYQRVSKIIEENFRRWNTDFATDCYHGGRNEQYFFWAGTPGHWFDYDLRSAYPTSMGILGKPDWKNIHEVSDPDYWMKVKPEELAFFNVEFEFPEDTRYPVLPVRTQYGLLYPLKGECCCSAPEIVVARNIGVKIKQIYVVRVEQDRSDKPFEAFISDCIEKRSQCEDGSLEMQFWKEITNGTYGKTAQGLRMKRAFNIRDEESKPLPPSKITNAFYASYTTSFVRAVLGEIVNALPPDVEVSNITTDGFLCTATRKEVLKALRGEVGSLYYKQALHFHGQKKLEKLDYLEIKHEVKQPLGWKTRGQATLATWEDEKIVLAKAGIRTSETSMDSDAEQNEEIIDMFLNRTPDTTFRVEYDASARVIYTWGSDNVRFESERSLNMEYDWKRCPDKSGIRYIRGKAHLFFDTKPWETVDDFMDCRDAWNNYIKDEKKNLKTIHDLEMFLAYKAEFVVKEKRKREHRRLKSKYLHRKDPQNQSLRMELCSAYSQGLIGFPTKDKRKLSYLQFAEILTRHGIKTSRFDVENGLKRAIQYHSVHRTPDLDLAVLNIKRDSGIAFDDSKLWDI